MTYEDFQLGWLGYLIAATYLCQLMQIFFYPVPSAGSTFEMIFKRSACHEPERSFLSNLSPISLPEKTLLVWATLMVVATAFLPLMVLLFPNIYGMTFPLFKSSPQIIRVFSALFLIAGNIITLVAVKTLRKQVSFHSFGETTRLYTGGLYRFMRNPITAGLCAVFAGFVMAIPSWAMIIGFIVFLLNSSRRIRMEEQYLEKTFGEEYLGYKKRVGKFWPRCYRT